jgi:hypothetical protein
MLWFMLFQRALESITSTMKVQFQRSILDSKPLSPINKIEDTFLFSFFTFAKNNLF